LSAAINGVCLALIDAGISMKSSFSSSTCCISKENEFLFDPTLEEQNVCLFYLFIFFSLFEVGIKNIIYY